MNDPFAPGLLHRLPRVPRNVAILKASRIGDFLCAVPAIRAIRRALPESEISVVAFPILRDVVERSPHIERFIPFAGYPGIGDQFFDARRTTRFFVQMQAEEFDLAIQMQGSGVYSNPATLLFGARMTAGFIRPGDSPGRLDAALPMPELDHEIRQLLAMADFLGAPRQGEDIEFPLWSEDYAAAEALLANARGPLIGLHPTARDTARRWPTERFAAAGAELARRYDGTTVIVAGPEERAEAGRMERLIGARCLNLVGRTSLPVLGALLTRLDLLITNDTGPAHIAYALRVPTVTILGGAHLTHYRPLGEGPFRQVTPPPVETKTDGECRADIGRVRVDQVVAAAAELLARSPGAG